MVRDVLSFYEVEAEGELIAVRLAGRLFCPEIAVAIRVDKRMDIRRGIGNREEVRTVDYQYHAWIRQMPGQRRRDLLRVDNNSHRPGLHAHLFDHDGRQVSSPDLALADIADA